MSLGFNSLLFVLPMVTVLREGLEGLVFVAGVSSILCTLLEFGFED